MRRLFLGVIQIFCLSLLILGFFIAFLPNLINTDWGSRQVIKAMNYFIPGEIEIQSLKLQWNKMQIIRGLTLKDSHGENILKIERLAIDASLWELFNQKFNLGFIQIKELSALLAINEKGQNNIQSALGIGSYDDLKPVSQLTLSHVNAHFHLFAKHHPFVLWARGMTQQKELKGSFEIDLVLNGMHFSNWDNFMNDLQQYVYTEGSRRAAVQMKFVHFPTDIIEHLFTFQSSKQIFRSLVGDYINISVSKKLNAEDYLIAEIQTPVIKGEINGRLSDGAFILQKPAHLRLNLTTNLFQQLTHPHSELYQLTHIDITSPYLVIPLKMLNSQTANHFCQCGFKVEIAMGKTEMNFHPLGTINVHHLKTQINSHIGENQLYIQSTGYAEYGTEPIHIQDERWFKNLSSFSTFLEDLKS